MTDNTPNVEAMHGHAAGEAHTHAVDVERSAWRDMGEPDTITVTIEPGDRLNN